MQKIPSRNGRILAIVLSGVVLLGLITNLFAGLAGPWMASISASSLILYLLWLMFWEPHIKVSQEGLELVNIFRVHQIPWPAVVRIDTRWALEIFTENVRYSAWSAPAPGRHTGLLASKDQGEHLPESTYLAGTVRPGDLVNSESGSAAATIRRMWEERKDLVSNLKEETKWQWGKLLTLLLLLAATAATTFFQI